MWFELDSEVRYLVFSQFSFPTPDLIAILSNNFNYSLGPSSNYTIFNKIVFDLSKYYVEGSGDALFDQLMVNVRVYSPYRRLLLTSIFKYLYQQDIEVDNFNGLELPEWDLGIDLNTNESIDIWINNLTPYLDELINVINKDILDEESHIGQGIGTDAGNRL